MCGIVGAMTVGSSADQGLIMAMIKQLSHRGPDGQQVYCDGPVGLAHSRLAILDLSDTGGQPMTNEDQTIWIVVNGEIYNYIELRQDLMVRGHVFRSTTDIEVILHAYEEWGMDCLQRLCGMFAFGLWDARCQRLWLVRDRLGIKPLFYARLPGVLLFASEIKALLAYPGVDRTVDFEGLSYYLALNYMPAPSTLFRNIRQLLPGRYLRVEADGRVEEHEYWRLEFIENETRSENDWIESFSSLLDTVVNQHLLADVPFGAFLSGGVDSSAVVYWMTQNLAEPVKTFTAKFNEDSFDESGYARRVARHLGTAHHEAVILPDVSAVLPAIVWHAEEPTADSSMVALYYLARAARQRVKMVLCGDGADEILAGYETYQAYFILRLLSWLPSWLRQGIIEPLVARLPSSDTKVNWIFKLRRFISGLGYPPESAHALWRQIFNREARQQLLGAAVHQPGMEAEVMDLYRALFARTNARKPLNRLLYVDTAFYLPNDMLVKVDRMTMAHGLEARVPFLDHRLVEFAARVPPAYKMRYFCQKKYLLKRSLEGRLPAKIIHRRKSGFNMPNARWIKYELRPFVMDVLSAASLKRMGIFDLAFVERLLASHFSGQSDNSHQIWCLLSLSLWWRQFQENAGAI